MPTAKHSITNVMIMLRRQNVIILFYVLHALKTPFRGVHAWNTGYAGEKGVLHPLVFA